MTRAIAASEQAECPGRVEGGGRGVPLPKLKATGAMHPSTIVLPLRAKGVFWAQIVSESFRGWDVA